MQGNLLIVPHSEDPSAIDATEKTLLDFPLQTFIVRDDGGEIVRSDGKIVAHAADPDFVVFACKKQGYVKSIERFQGD